MDIYAQPQRLPHHTDEYLAANKGGTIVSTTVALAIITTLFVGARLYTRAKFLGKLQIDDWLITVSVACMWLSTICAIQGCRAGNGRHFDTLSLHQISGAIFWTILGFPFGGLAFTIPKFAVVTLLTRVMNPSRKHRIFLWCLPSLCLTTLLGCIIIQFAQCSPIQSQWDLTITEKTCISYWILVYFAGVAGGVTVFVDLYLAIYPAVVLWGLQLRLRKKLALCAALSIGSVAAVVAIYKCTRLPSLTSKDFSWETSDLSIWTVVEAATIIIACCIPTLQPLVDFLFGRRVLDGSSAYKNYGDSRSAQLKSGIEMHSGVASRNRTVNQSRIDRQHTIGDRTDVESQENILSMKPQQGPGIKKTQMVTVTYETQDDDDSITQKHSQSPDKNTSWANV